MCALFGLGLLVEGIVSILYAAHNKDIGNKECVQYPYYEVKDTCYDVKDVYHAENAAAVSWDINSITVQFANLVNRSHSPIFTHHANISFYNQF